MDLDIGVDPIGGWWFGKGSKSKSKNANNDSAFSKLSEYFRFEKNEWIGLDELKKLITDYKAKESLGDPRGVCPGSDQNNSVLIVLDHLLRTDNLPALKDNPDACEELVFFLFKTHIESLVPNNKPSYIKKLEELHGDDPPRTVVYSSFWEAWENGNPLHMIDSEFEATSAIGTQIYEWRHNTPIEHFFGNSALLGAISEFATGAGTNSSIIRRLKKEIELDFEKKRKEWRKIITLCLNQMDIKTYFKILQKLLPIIQWEDVEWILTETKSTNIAVYQLFQMTGTMLWHWSSYKLSEDDKPRYVPLALAPPGSTHDGAYPTILWHAAELQRKNKQKANGVVHYMVRYLRNERGEEGQKVSEMRNSAGQTFTEVYYPERCPPDIRPVRDRQCDDRPDIMDTAKTIEPGYGYIWPASKIANPDTHCYSSSGIYRFLESKETTTIPRTGTKFDPTQMKECFDIAEHS